MKPSIDALTIEEFLGATAQGIFIPRYQRHFSWDKGHFNRFLEDITKDIMAEDEPGPRTFLGSIICYLVQKGKDPDLPKDLPPSPYLIIDGQQRITMIVTMAILLHYKIKTQFRGGENRWVDQETRKTLVSLKNLISVDMGDNIRAPKIIRAEADIWSKDGEGEYLSPIASFTHRYLKYLDNPGADSFDISDASESNIFNELAEKLNEAIDEFPKEDIAKNLKNNRKFMEELWGEDGVDEAFNLMNKNKRLFEFLLLVRFLRTQMYVIHVTILGRYDGSYAIFDRLNTAGASLNVFESFKPNIIRVMDKKYPGSAQEKIVKEIEGSYVEIEDRKQSDAYVSELITSFALAYSGDKLSKNLIVQRDYLLKHFKEPSKDSGHLLEYLQCLRSVNKMKQLFGGGKDDLEIFLRTCKISIDDELDGKIDEASFCLRFLKEAGFKITVSLLSIYLHQVLKRPEKNSIKQFCDAICIIAAFCAIWRSSAEDTNNIDDRIRKIMQNPHKNGVMQLCTSRENKGAEPLTSNELKKLFRLYIAEEYKLIKNAKTWGDEVAKRQIYKNTGLVRFILLVGSHNTRAEKQKTPRLELVPNDSVKPLIAAGSFDDDLFRSVEHIIPKNESEGYDSGYTKEQKNQLWNLTLLPGPINATFNNKTWPKKHAMYRYFSAESPAEHAQSIEELKPILGKKLSKFLKKHEKRGYLPMTKYYALLNTKSFRKTHSAKRNEAIFDNCWRKLAKEWLGWKMENN